jgi:hypothetical protein
MTQNRDKKMSFDNFDPYIHKKLESLVLSTGMLNKAMKRSLKSLV